MIVEWGALWALRWNGWLAWRVKAWRTTCWLLNPPKIRLFPDSDADATFKSDISLILKWSNISVGCMDNNCSSWIRRYTVGVINIGPASGIVSSQVKFVLRGWERLDVRCQCKPCCSQLSLQAGAGAVVGQAEELKILRTAYNVKPGAGAIKKEIKCPM